MKSKHFSFILVLVLATTGCIKVDNLFFEAASVSSIEDYDNLPLASSQAAPSWVEQASVERELYIGADGKPIKKETLKNHDEYIHCVFLHAPKSCSQDDCPLINSGVTYLYQHGNSGHLFRYWSRAVTLWSQGANVVIYTYRGYGLSKGTPSRKSVLEDAETVATYLFSREDVDTDRVIPYGYSMGGIPTSFLVGESRYRNRFFAVILESALDSPDSTLSLSTNTEVPSGFFMDDSPFDGPSFISNAPKRRPILHMHGGQDNRVVPLQADAYFEKLKSRQNYTHYIGKETNDVEAWLRHAHHRNVPNASFNYPEHIGDLYNDPDNPAHCCIHPVDYTDPSNAAFLKNFGHTTAKEAYASVEKYQALITSWVLAQLREDAVN
jgi:fermentation-respiration switch protein FrsA (DUF1100 family)